MPKQRVLDSGPSERGWHRLETVLRCPTLHAFRTRLPQGAKSAPLVRGTIGHVGLAHHYAHMRAAQEHQTCDLATPDEAMQIVAKSLGRAGEELLPVARAAVEHYIARFSSEQIQIIAVEEEVRAEVACEKIAPGRKFLFTQRLDLVFRDRSGRVWISDHKFTSKPSRGTVERYTLSGQFLGFEWFGKKLWGKDFGGSIANLIGTVEPLHVERARVPPAPAMLARFPQIVVDAELMIERLADRAPWDYPRAANEITCAQVYGERCEFWELCQWGAPQEHAPALPVTLE